MGPTSGRPVYSGPTSRDKGPTSFETRRGHGPCGSHTAHVCSGRRQEVVHAFYPRAGFPRLSEKIGPGRSPRLSVEGVRRGFPRGPGVGHGPLTIGCTVVFDRLIRPSPSGVRRPLPSTGRRSEDRNDRAAVDSQTY